MKYFNKMITNLMVENEFIQHEERFEIEQDLLDSSSDFSKSNIGKFITMFLKSPLGVVVILILYAFALTKFRDLKNKIDDSSENEEFRKEIKRQVMKDLLK